MAIIKCPECGHQVSDKAPTCPQCGVEIAGKIEKCPQCGDVHFKEQQVCPNCHYGVQGAWNVERGVPSEDGNTPGDAQGTWNMAHGLLSEDKEASEGGEPKDNTPSTEIPKAPKSHTGTIVVAFVLALIVCGACFYFYKNAKDQKEQEAYEYALRSTDPLVMQSYLDNYLDAPADHRDAVQTHLTAIKQVDIDWTNAVVSNSRSALEEYLKQHPDSPHKAEALNKLDSIDWMRTGSANTVEAYENYIAAHPNGSHVEDARESIKAIQAQTVQPEERQMIATLFKRFFQSINAKDEDGMLSHVGDVLSSFLGKADADKGDVATFMHKIYKENVTNMNWRLAGDYKIDKKEIGEQRYEYNVAFSATQDVEYADDTTTKTKYQVKATVSPDGKITAMNMVKLLQ